MTSPGPDFYERAACNGKPLEWFFPKAGGVEASAAGLKLCAVCPVRSECMTELHQAERDVGCHLPGVWAGTTTRERRLGRPRVKERQSTPRFCVVCGIEFPDTGFGLLPQFCTSTRGACGQRAHYRKSVGAPVTDIEFAAWKERQRVHDPRSRRRDPRAPHEKVGA